MLLTCCNSWRNQNGWQFGNASTASEPCKLFKLKKETFSLNIQVSIMLRRKVETCRFPVEPAGRRFPGWAGWPPVSRLNRLAGGFPVEPAGRRFPGWTGWPPVSRLNRLAGGFPEEPVSRFPVEPAGRRFPGFPVTRLTGKPGNRETGKPGPGGSRLNPSRPGYPADRVLGNSFIW